MYSIGLIYRRHIGFILFSYCPSPTITVMYPNRAERGVLGIQRNTHHIEPFSAVSGEFPSSRFSMALGYCKVLIFRLCTNSGVQNGTGPFTESVPSKPHEAQGVWVRLPPGTQLYSALQYLQINVLSEHTFGKKWLWQVMVLPISEFSFHLFWDES